MIGPSLTNVMDSSAYKGDRMAAMPEGEVFTVREIAKLLKIKVATVRALIKNGDLKAGRVGHNYRVGREELQEYMIRNGLLRSEE